LRCVHRRFGFESTFGSGLIAFIGWSLFMLTLKTRGPGLLFQLLFSFSRGLRSLVICLNLHGKFYGWMRKLETEM
jgi:hypothetical protein